MLKIACVVSNTPLDKIDKEQALRRAETNPVHCVIYSGL